MYKLGKLPARPNSVKFKFVNYLTAPLPKVPKNFGHETLVSNFPMFGNDQYGDCVWAGAGHEHQIWVAEGKSTSIFTDKNILDAYSAVTGFNPNDPNTDQGTDMQAAASYRRKTGITDANGGTHRIDAYLALTPGNIAEHLQALYLFGAVGIGLNFPDSAMAQFDKGRPWSIVARSHIEGGHYVPLVARRNNKLECVTWGRIQPMTDSFFKRYNDESIVYLSEEILSSGKSPEGFDLQQLIEDMKSL